MNTYKDQADAYRDAKDMERYSCVEPVDLDEPEEHTTHTEGEWTRHPLSDEEVRLIPAGFRSKEFEACDIVIGSGEKVVATIQYWSGNEGYPRASSLAEAEANARLIMAAPKLLKSLKEMVAIQEGTKDKDSNFLGRARQAIAKATGAA